MEKIEAILIKPVITLDVLERIDIRACPLRVHTVVRRLVFHDWPIRRDYTLQRIKR
jgi:hypothetical protein